MINETRNPWLLLAESEFDKQVGATVGAVEGCEAVLGELHSVPRTVTVAVLPVLETAPARRPDEESLRAADRFTSTWNSFREAGSTNEFAWFGCVEYKSAVYRTATSAGADVVAVLT
ncbi:MAG: hypothetical protein M3O28_06305 [Actinomycetota bacterium]|nr:hypothetical protein [Actinomycetota bacterium]